MRVDGSSYIEPVRFLYAASQANKKESMLRVTALGPIISLRQLQNARARVIIIIIKVRINRMRRLLWEAATDELGLLLASGVLSLVLIFNTIDGDFIEHPMALATSLGCVVALYRLKAHKRRLAGLLALCLLAAVLGMLSARFREAMHEVALAFWRPQNHFASTVIAPIIEARHVGPTIDDRSADEGRALYTNHARRFIEASQALGCDAAHNVTRVFQVGAYRSGMGSELHFHAAVLANAIEERALFDWGPGACALFGAHCRALYQPEHLCSVERLRQMRVVHFTQDDWPVERVPRALLDLLPKNFTVQQALLWWRAQAIGYLMRFGPETRSRIDALRAGQVRLGGAINVNLRGGDKMGEARPIAPERYVDKALELIELAPLTYSRVLFLTSDDPREIARAHVYATARGLASVYLDAPRMPNGNAEGQVAAFWTYNVTLSVLLQLTMTAECAAWIGSRTSNWNRVIDMYRCTVVANCRGVFVEMEDAIRGYYYTRPMGQI
jgi:hypothetical protein